jgi:hypothetical protein
MEQGDEPRPLRQLNCSHSRNDNGGVFHAAVPAGMGSADMHVNLVTGDQFFRDGMHLGRSGQLVAGQGEAPASGKVTSWNEG